MIPASGPDRRHGRLLWARADGRLKHLERSRLAMLFGAGDVIVANDAATLPASLFGRHARSGQSVEMRLAGWPEPVDWSMRRRRFVAVVFGTGDYRTPTEDRPPPPTMAPGDRITFGPLEAEVLQSLGHARLLLVRFSRPVGGFLPALARQGRPVQYAHVPEPLALWDVWTSLAARPVCFEPPSAGFALNWSVLDGWRRGGAVVATLTHAAGLSSTGDVALDQRLPLDEPYRIPEATAAMVNAGLRNGRRIVAVGTTVVRALEAAAGGGGAIRPGHAVARNRIGPATQLRVVDALLTGMHQPGESHFDLLRAFADRRFLTRVNESAETLGYRSHEFGDSLLIERQVAAARQKPSAVAGAVLSPALQIG